MLFGALAACATAVLGRRLFGELAGLVAGLALVASETTGSWLGAPLVATLLASIAQPAFEARYVLVAMPALALAIGAAVASLPRRPALVLAVALALSAGIRLGQHYVQSGEPLL